MIEKHLGKILIAITIIAVLGLFFPLVQSGMLGAGTRFTNGLSADSTSPVAGEVRGTTLTITSTSAFTGLLSAVTETLSGLLTTNGGQLRSNSLATSTGSATMDVTYLSGYDTVVVNATGAVGAKTLTFFASSTASTWLPTAGDMQETCFLNATTAASNLVFAAGTGIDLQVATSTSQTGAFDLTLSPDSTGCFKFIRKAATASAFDIEANFIEYENAD